VKPLDDILVERTAQDAKWGEQNHDPFKWVAIATEELGEAAKAVLENNLHDYREELIDLAAVCVAAMESLDRKRGQ
jgi:NTP pyrophosphatase (non-canonical NTP hydrolase)